jgi:hypothetical protein
MDICKNQQEIIQLTISTTRLYKIRKKKHNIQELNLTYLIFSNKNGSKRSILECHVDGMEPRRVVICRQISNYFLIPKGERLAVSLKFWWGELFSEKVTECRYLHIIVIVIIINIHNYDDTEKEEEKGGDGRRKTMSYSSSTLMIHLFIQ